MMNSLKVLYVFFCAILILTQGCVSKKKVAEIQKNHLNELAKAANDLQMVKQELVDTEKEGMALRTEVKGKNVEIQNLINQQKINAEQLEYLKKTNSNLLERLSDLSLVNKTSSENMRKSLEALNEQSKLTKDLTDYLARKDSVNLALAADLKPIIEQKPEMFNLEIKNKVLILTIYDSQVFEDNGCQANAKNDSTLKSLTNILLKHKNSEILAVGHTSNVILADYDNWELGFKKTNSLLKKLLGFGINANKIIVANAADTRPISTKNQNQNKRTELWFIQNADAYLNLKNN